LPPYLIQKRFIVYYPPDQLIWNGQTFDTEREAIEGVNEFFGFESAWYRLRASGWVIKRASLSIKL
jgi:hypothetical protein